MRVGKGCGVQAGVQRVVLGKDGSGRHVLALLSQLSTSRGGVRAAPQGAGGYPSGAL